MLYREGTGGSAGQLQQQQQQQGGSKSCEFRWDRGRLYDQTAATLLHEGCVAAPTATVTSVGGRHRSKWAPAPLSTLEMQKCGSQVR